MECRILSAECGIPSTQYPVLSTQYFSTQYSVLSTRYSEPRTWYLDPQSDLTAFAGGPALISVRFADLPHAFMQCLPVVTHHPQRALLRLEPFARFSPADSLMRWKAPSNRRNRAS